MRRFLAKLVLRSCGSQAKEACGNLQLCGGLEAGIEGAAHAVREWAERELEDAIGTASDTVTAADAGGDAEDDEPMAESGGGSDNLEAEGVEEEEGAMSSSYL